MSSPITSLLQLSLPKPSSISSTDSDTGGAVLALALHALAINDGFNVAKKSAEQNLSSQKNHESSYVPAKGWDTALEDQFIFTLSKNGCANHFTLHCSLEPRSGRMFVHASEEGRPQNIQVLGLQLENYVTQDMGVLRGKKWEGVIKNEAVLQTYFSEHISQPLVAAAQKVSLCSPFPANTFPSTNTNTSDVATSRGSSSPRAAGGGSSSPRAGPISSISRQPLSWLSCAAAAAGKMQAREMALAAALGTGTMGVVLLLMYQKSRVYHSAGRQMVAV